MNSLSITNRALGVSLGLAVLAFCTALLLPAFELDGKKLWQTGLGTGSSPHRWGSASSPILYRNLVIVTASAESESPVALDKETGKEVWRRKDAGFSGTWGTPILVDCGKGRTDLVITVPPRSGASTLTTGSSAGSARGYPTGTVCSSAVVRDGVVYVLETGPRGGGTMPSGRAATAT